ncbi:MAG TPA: DNA-3-methyladenine glycosylase I, partial [Actinomycetales bacterium]|nr:DNA-3-methyladenine glycosylase I [Actinomycetales bacterium]
MTADGVVVGDDGLARCAWGAAGDLYRGYHDDEWGRPAHGEQALYERFTLEAFQSGLSWITILRKRPAFREAFDGFDPETVAGYGDADRARLLADAGIVRNRAKVDAAITNAAAVLRMREEVDGGLDSLVWSFAPDPPPPSPRTTADVRATTAESVALSKALKRQGM